MSDWTVALTELANVGSMSTVGEEGPLGDFCLTTNNAATTSGVWPTASLALFHPILVKNFLTIYGFGWNNGATSSGNVDAGLYDSENNLVASVGGVAQGTISVLQTASITATSIKPGMYYLAMVMDNTTGTALRASAGTAQQFRASGAFQMASAYPLPSTAVPATYAQAFVVPISAFINGATF